MPSNLRVFFSAPLVAWLALERLLYALDPYESNEALVAQRRLLATGTPRRIEAAVKDGNIYLSGEVLVKGVIVEIPRVERLNLSGLPGLERYEGYPARLEALLRVLEIASARTLRMDAKGGLTAER